MEERYGPSGDFSYVYEGNAITQQQIHEELLFNMWKAEGLINLIVPTRRQLAKAKAGYKKDRAAFIERHLAAKVPKTRADNMADVEFSRKLEEIELLEAELELFKLALQMRKNNQDNFRTLASDVRNYA